MFDPDNLPSLPRRIILFAASAIGNSRILTTIIQFLLTFQIFFNQMDQQRRNVCRGSIRSTVTECDDEIIDGTSYPEYHQLYYCHAASKGITLWQYLSFIRFPRHRQRETIRFIIGLRQTRESYMLPLSCIPQSMICKSSYRQTDFYVFGVEVKIK